MSKPALFARMGLVLAMWSLGMSAGALQTREAGSANSQAGQRLYQLNCAGCHALDARGGEHGPNIATVQRVQQLTDAGLLRILREGISGAGMPAFGSRLNPRELAAVAAHLRTLQGKRKALPLPGNAETGRALFFNKAGCSECHMVAGKGGFIAGDLSTYAVTRSIEQIRGAILNPDRNLDPSHTLAIVVTQDGRRYTGVVRNEDGFSLQLQARDGTFHLFEKSTLTSIARDPRSFMPANYGSKLSPGDVNDLISYLMQVAATQPKPADDSSEW